MRASRSISGSISPRRAYPGVHAWKAVQWPAWVSGGPANVAGQELPRVLPGARMRAQSFGNSTSTDRLSFARGPAPRATQTPMLIRDRIRDLRRVPGSELRPNPRNWRTHPPEQTDALRGMFAEVGSRTPSWPASSTTGRSSSSMGTSVDPTGRLQKRNRVAQRPGRA